MRDVYVLGVGQSNFGKLPQFTAAELGMQAAAKAVKDAGIDPRILEVAYGARAVDGSTTVQDILKNLGVVEIEMNNVENACASGITAANLLFRDIAYGAYDIGIAIGVEAMTTSSLAGKLLGANKDDINGQLGLSMPGYFALMTRRFMAETGATAADIAYPSLKNHKNGCLNPYSMYKKNMSVEDILNSRIISDPITLYECCPTTDGAAAVIYCSKEIAQKYTTKFIQIRSSRVMSACYEDPAVDITGFPMAAKLAAASYELSGLGPEDIDCVELHDAFSPEELWAYCDLGLCQKEEVLSFIHSGAPEIGGKCAVNASGGLLSLGHPLGASGVRVICEVALQLRGDAGQHQVPGAKVGLAQMMGGFLSGLAAPIAEGIQILSC